TLSHPDVTIENGRAVTTSVAIAEFFGKRHDNVIQKIKLLDCSAEFTALNFKASEYTDSTGRKLPMYQITKNGFVFLVMGFTGKKAAAFKEAYIAEFDRM
ncbi:Rha family transcriptional regulator, partial [Escherichia coli]